MFMKFINNFMCACAMLKWFDLVVYFLELKIYSEQFMNSAVNLD